MSFVLFNENVCTLYFMLYLQCYRHTGLHARFIDYLVHVSMKYQVVIRYKSVYYSFDEMQKFLQLMPNCNFIYHNHVSR